MTKNWLEAGLANPALVEQMYEEVQRNPNNVDASWYFAFIEPYRTLVKHVEVDVSENLKVYNLIQAYRIYGHLWAKVNPIATHQPEEPSQLKLEPLGFKESDLKRQFPTYGILPQATASLEEIIETLKQIYCRSIGYEYMYVENSELRSWLQQKIETESRKDLSLNAKQLILDHLNRSELFESFIHTKYTGQKRFSLEGAETLIPMLEDVIEEGSNSGTEVFVIGMAHRGRLNVLSNILRKSHVEIFSEFEENYIPNSFEGSGDVKYHKGFFSEVKTPDGKLVKIFLAPNPSHLESVDPVVEGQTKAKQETSENYTKIMPILIHGDAAISGQGVLYETLQLNRLPGYATGGTLHFVINNQIGFTTTPEESRSTRYCTDVAKTFSAPVFHVNAEDPEACLFVTHLAVQIRQKFHCDVLIDLNGYRKYGHNESDEPAYTQPQEYQLIRSKKPIREIYRDQLIQEGIVEKSLAESLEKEFTSSLQAALQESKIGRPTVARKETKITDHFPKIKTAVTSDVLKKISEMISAVPTEFKIHPKLHHLVEERMSMIIEEQKPIDWGMAELLAYGTLLWDGYQVRLSGQDCKRGTFSHRHAAWKDQAVENTYYPLEHLKEGQGKFEVCNSPLSEYACLGFEYGYSVADPNALVIWEAQFGDFCNGGQIIIDQYIATSEQKWGQTFSLVLFLPHGYEGQGPEHSSGRMERFLALCGNDNMRVVNPTTPAQFFHLLRKQVLNPDKKPLIVFTPKGLLRHPACVSSVKEFTHGEFQEIIEDDVDPKDVKVLVFCTGRLYYDLIEERKKRNSADIAFVRLEQLYPTHTEKLKKMIKKYKHADRYVWAQEEPCNMGAWEFIGPILQSLLPKQKTLQYVGRSRSASPATGSYAMHKKQHAEILRSLFDREGRKK